MPAVREITALDTVELMEPVAGVPAGARAGVLELCDDDAAMIEVTSIPLEPILDRIIFVPLSKLRRLS